MKVKQQQHININLKTNAHNLNHMCLINGFPFDDEHIDWGAFYSEW